MADYLPLYKPGLAFTRQASASVTAGQLVAVSGDGTVAPAGAAAENWIGVAAFDAATGSNVTVHAGGVQRIVASGAVTAGDLVVAAAAGTVATLADVTTPTAGDVSGTRAMVGVALTTAVDGDLVEVQIQR